MDIFIWLIVILILAAVVYFGKKPTPEKDWRPDQMQLPFAVVGGQFVSVYNIRHCLYNSKTDYQARYYNKTLDIKNLTGVDFIHQPFKRYILAGHTFLSFKFADGYHLAVSVEARRKKSEEYSSLKGLMRAYQLIYILADERDILKVRSLHHGDDVFIYPVKITPEQTQKFFLDILERINKIKARPEFYNTLTNNCATNLIKHANQALGLNIRYRLEILFPKHAEKLFSKLDLLDISEDFKKHKKHFLVNEKVKKYNDQEESFSIRIREKNQADDEK